VTWVTWRQHRLEALWALVFAGLLGGVTAYTAYELWVASAGCPRFSGLGGYCLSNDVFGHIAQSILRFNLFQYGLVVLPALAGAFIGAPLVAREIENGTQHLAWTQGVTRTRWLVTKLVLVIVPLLVVAALVGYLEVVFLNVQGPQVNRWDVFDQQTPVVPAATLFALALGVAFGAVIGRSVPAMAATLVTFVIVRVGIGELARSHYIAPVMRSTHDLTALGSQADPTAWWLGFPNYYDSSEHLLGNLLGQGVGQQASYAVQYFQPGDRFWAFQTIESAILAGLALVILGFAAYWVTRRLT
jgi:ABC-type transport system involved in multi-copper enzyme maturation permease subunit